MTTCLEKSCKFGLLSHIRCLSVVNVDHFLCVLLSLLIRDLIVLIPDLCLSLNIVLVSRRRISPFPF